MNDYLIETELCDWKNKEILRVADELKDKSLDKREYAVNAFYWVRDNIYYFAEPLSKASKILDRKMGDCFTKSNLLVALLKANDIPARFQFQSITGEAMLDIIKLNAEVKEAKKFKFAHCIVNAMPGERWLRVDCTRDKYLSPDRANEWDGRDDTEQHPHFVKDLEYASDLQGYERYTGPKKFKNWMDVGNILMNAFIDEERYNNSGIRSFSEEDSARMIREVHDLMAKAMETKHRGDARVVSWMMKRLFSKPLGLNVEVLECDAKKVKYLCHCCVSNDVFSHMGQYFSSLDNGIAHGINPKLEFTCKRGDDGIGHVEIINKDGGSHYRPYLRDHGKGCKKPFKKVI